MNENENGFRRSVLAAVGVILLVLICAAVSSSMPETLMSLSAKLPEADVKTEEAAEPEEKLAPEQEEVQEAEPEPEPEPKEPVYYADPWPSFGPEEPIEAAPVRLSDTYVDYELSEEDYAFLEKSVFVGDSICSGLYVFDILPRINVLATASVSAWNIFDYGRFSVNGVEYGILEALKALPYTPEYVIFSMGMNDINMGPKENFVTNYQRLIDSVRQVMPESKMAICAVTPISSTSSFSTNEKIDEYNAALREYAESSGYRFIDINTPMKGTDNCMKPDYHSGDGIHLMIKTYDLILYHVSHKLPRG